MARRLGRLKHKVHAHKALEDIKGKSFVHPAFGFFALHDDDEDSSSGGGGCCNINSSVQKTALARAVQASLCCFQQPAMTASIGPNCLLCQQKECLPHARWWDTTEFNKIVELMHWTLVRPALRRNTTSFHSVCMCVGACACANCAWCDGSWAGGGGGEVAERVEKAVDSKRPKFLVTADAYACQHK